MLSMYGGEAGYKIKYVCVNFDLKNAHRNKDGRKYTTILSGCWNGLSTICTLY